MAHIAIISASIRQGRQSHKVALYLQQFIARTTAATTQVIDLAAYNFPLFEERLSHQPAPTEAMLSFAHSIAAAHGIIIVTPEYNGGYPAALKNAIDLLYNEWHRKPVAISTVSDGAFAGTQVITSLQFSLWKMRALMVPAQFPVPHVSTAFSPDGTPADAPATDKRAQRFVEELMWCIEAKKRMEQSPE